MEKAVKVWYKEVGKTGKKRSQPVAYTRRQLAQTSAHDVEEKRALSKELVDKFVLVDGVRRQVVGTSYTTGDVLVRIGTRDMLYDPRTLPTVR